MQREKQASNPIRRTNFAFRRCLICTRETVEVNDGECSVAWIRSERDMTIRRFSSLLLCLIGSVAGAPLHSADVRKTEAGVEAYVLAQETPPNILVETNPDKGQAKSADAEQKKMEALAADTNKSATARNEIEIG